MNFVLGPAPAVAMVVAVLLGAAVAWAARLGTSRATVTAALRATLQLGLVSLLIGGIVGSFALSALFVAVMVVVAARTAGTRMTDDRSGWWAALPIAATPLPVVGALVLAGVVPATGISVIPTAGILIGGTMTASALAGKRALDELEARRGEVEAALSLGFVVRDAAIEITRPSAASALVPVTDQTRTVGHAGELASPPSTQHAAKPARRVRRDAARRRVPDRGGRGAAAGAAARRRDRGGGADHRAGLPRTHPPRHRARGDPDRTGSTESSSRRDESWSRHGHLGSRAADSAVNVVPLTSS